MYSIISEFCSIKSVYAIALQSATYYNQQAFLFRSIKKTPLLFVRRAHANHFFHSITCPRGSQPRHHQTHLWWMIFSLLRVFALSQIRFQCFAIKICELKWWICQQFSQRSDNLIRKPNRLCAIFCCCYYFGPSRQQLCLLGSPWIFYLCEHISDT